MRGPGELGPRSPGAGAAPRDPQSFRPQREGKEQMSLFVRVVEKFLSSHCQQWN